MTLGLLALRQGDVGRLPPPSRGVALAAAECPAGRPSAHRPDAVSAFIDLPAPVMAVVEGMAAAVGVAPEELVRTACNIGGQILVGETDAGLPAAVVDAVRIALGAAISKRAARGAREGTIGR